LELQLNKQLLDESRVNGLKGTTEQCSIHLELYRDAAPTGVGREIATHMHVHDGGKSPERIFLGTLVEKVASNESET
jgi:hypothetical protein